MGQARLTVVPATRRPTRKRVAFHEMLPTASISPLGIAGLVVLGAALLVLLISLLHPEGLRRPGGYLDGQEPRPPHEGSAKN